MGKKKNRGAMPVSRSPPPGPLPGAVKASLALALAGLLATFFWYAALALHAAAIFLGWRALGAPDAAPRTRTWARAGLSLGLLGAALTAALLGLVLLGRLDWYDARLR